MNSIAPHITPALLLRIAEGDDKAMRILYDEFYKPLLFYAESLIHDRVQAEDIVLTAFTKYWERRASFDNVAAVRSFFYITTRNACYKHYHQLKNKDRHLKMAGDMAMEADEFAESRMVIAEMVHQLYKEVNNLSPKYRDVIQLLFVEERSIRETADLLQITPENVRKRKERAVELLRGRIVRNNLSPLLLLVAVMVK
ncbi:MAG: sigma-70 family RNA polymerase sigma factor [Chitinophagaceae bacterium]|nr:sigma-70 family RNA polymerase sigma factor [Chitinophagaceae bacterium]